MGDAMQREPTSLRELMGWFPRRQEIGDFWDIVAAGLAFPLAASGLWALGVEAPLATEPVLSRLPFAAVLVAVIVKLMDGGSAHETSRPPPIMPRIWSISTVPLLVFWVLFFSDQVREISPLLLVASWLLLVSATLLPRILAMLGPAFRKAA